MGISSQNFYLVQAAFLGFIFSGGISAMLASVLELFIEPIAGRLLIPAVPATGAAAAFVLCVRARGWLRTALRALAEGGHRAEDRNQILSDILSCSGLQACTAGAGVSLSLHFAALAAPTNVVKSARVSYVYTYNLFLCAAFGIFLVLSIINIISRLLFGASRKRKQS